MVFMPHWPLPTDRIGMDAKQTPLERMSAILERLGNPHTQLPPTIHVAGTNGKGSTIAFLRAILEAAGQTVHTYTTPHLIHFNERIVLAGKDITDSALSELMEECRIKTEGLSATFFEITTAAAFLAFSRTKADFLLLETGMGGALDPTNVIEHPLLTILTSISYDHTEALGQTLEDIAQHKVGIMKRGAACVASLQEMRMLKVIDDAANALGIDWYGFEFDYSIEFSEEDTVKFVSRWGDISLPKPALLGVHQYLNAATAITAVKVAVPNISDACIVEGITNAKWIGRMQRVNKPYIPKEWTMYVDGGHNPAAARALATTIDEWHIPTVLIIGMTQKRDITKFLEPFRGLVTHIATVTVQSEPLPYSAEVIAETARGLGFDAHACEDIPSAVAGLMERTPENGGNIIVCGSLFLVADMTH